ncbi:hypothetical protein LTR56_025665 [Elasticomyces elasticus]|nr:hypothetical protein LTR56_025665 [Elasticomyces elasticus]KAK4901439.1 hypothetical protein LTR49_027254 [Elasticomyces elasticus]KAK5738994.1 hypothetical protein LTS12_025410 [Elasticomyces elasticus]
MAIHARLPFSFSTDRPPVPWPIQQGTFDTITTNQAAVRLWEEIMAQVRSCIARLQDRRASAQETAQLLSQLHAMETSAAQGAALAQARAEESSENEDDSGEE